MNRLWRQRARGGNPLTRWDRIGAPSPEEAVLLDTTLQAHWKTFIAELDTVAEPPGALCRTAS